MRNAGCLRKGTVLEFGTLAPRGPGRCRRAVNSHQGNRPPENWKATAAASFGGRANSCEWLLPRNRPRPQGRDCGNNPPPQRRPNFQTGKVGSRCKRREFFFFFFAPVHVHFRARAIPVPDGTGTTQRHPAAMDGNFRGPGHGPKARALHAHPRSAQCTLKAATSPSLRSHPRRPVCRCVRAEHRRHRRVVPCTNEERHHQPLDCGVKRTDVHRRNGRCTARTRARASWRCFWCLLVLFLAGSGVTFRAIATFEFWSPGVMEGTGLTTSTALTSSP